MRRLPEGVTPDSQHPGAARLVITRIGAQRLVERPASPTFAERGVSHPLVSALEPGRFKGLPGEPVPAPPPDAERDPGQAP